MKKRYSLILLLIVATWFSCKKSESPAPKDATSYSATIDKVNWTPADFSATYRYQIFALSGKSSSGETVIIRIKLVAGNELNQAYYEFYYNDDVSVALYRINDNDAVYGSNQFDGSVPAPGRISFTKFDKTQKKVSGTYKVKVKRVTDNTEKTLEGTFENVSYDDKLPTLPSKSLSAKVDGTAWSASTVNASSSIITKVIQITGNSSNGSAIVLTVPYKVLPGTYNIAIFGSLTAQFNPSTTTSMPGETGTITVTAHDPDAEFIQGSFQFNAVEQSLGQKSISSGAFSAVY